MNLPDWLPQQRQLYPNQNLDETEVEKSAHPVSGTWQDNSPHLKSRYWWGGGASQESLSELAEVSTDLTHVAVLTFGPVQAFLSGGQKLRDWAVASWLCHYLSATIIYRWQEAGGKILLPRHQNSALLQWMRGDKSSTALDSNDFWRAELPNVFTGLHPGGQDWLDAFEQVVWEEWLEFVKSLKGAVKKLKDKEDSEFQKYIQRTSEKLTPKKIKEKERQRCGYKYLWGKDGWDVIFRDHQYLWSVYARCKPLQLGSLSEDIDSLHRDIEADKNGRRWQASWWGGRTSRSDGAMSIWHPGLRPIDRGGTWGLPDQTLNPWWQRLATESKLKQIFSSSDRLNSIELIKRLASIPEVMEGTLCLRWKPDEADEDHERKIRLFPAQEEEQWERFPDRTAAAASWVIDCVSKKVWNDEIAKWHRDLLKENPLYKWGMPKVDRDGGWANPRVLERRNVRDKEKQTAKDTDSQQQRNVKDEQKGKEKDKSLLEKWDETIPSPSDWACTVEWTVGWRGDGDDMGKWLSGEQYEALKLPWSDWHPEDVVLSPPQFKPPNQHRKIDLPHILDLSILFGKWNQLLTQLVEEYHHGKVIFAGGDDFLLLGPLTEAVSLTSELHRLWQGKEILVAQAEEKTPLIQPLKEGWVKYWEDSGAETIYPVPGKKIDFSLGVVIAQRRIPQSLWHRGLEEAYKEAKNQGKNRICINVLFNSGQSLNWVCPWPLWNLLMPVEPHIETSETTVLNRWEKLLGYLSNTRLQENSVSTVGALLDTLWESVGIPLCWEEVTEVAGLKFLSEIEAWQWWLDWVSLKVFLARQERERRDWVEKVMEIQN